MKRLATIMFTETFAAHAALDHFVDINKMVHSGAAQSAVLESY